MRGAAVERLTDQAALAPEVALNASDEDVYKAAVKKLDDQAALANVAKKGRECLRARDGDRETHRPSGPC